MDLHKDYERAGFGNRLPFGDRPALLIVDVVRAYLDPASPLYARGEAALASNVRLREAAHAKGVPVILTRVLYEPQGRDGGWFYRKIGALEHFREGSPFAIFPAELAPTPQDIIVTKQYASAFFGTTLASTLCAMGVDSLLITGYSTSGCVRATALDALQHGFRPFVVKDACADRDPRPHEANLFDLQQKYAEVIGEAEALDLLANVTAR